MRVQMSCYVQNLEVTTPLEFVWGWNEISIEFAYDEKIVSKMVSHGQNDYWCPIGQQPHDTGININGYATSTFNFNFNITNK